MSSSNGGRRGALSEINVTPLVDVMLVLLVVFMVTTPMIVDSMREVGVDLPTTDAKPVTASQLQTILLLDAELNVKLDLGHEDGASLLVTCKEAKTGPYEKCLGPLRAQLELNPSLKDGRRVFLLADRTLPYGFVVDVMARLKKAGIANLGMVTNPPGDPG